MSTLFIGGSRHVSRLPADVKKRLENVIESNHCVIVGDANGADKAVQKYFFEADYKKVTVFCSGDNFRNNLGGWKTHNVYPSKHLKGFHFYAAKDREMAEKADFGLMIWDGKSAGTILNVLRLVRAGKIAVLFSVPDKIAINIKNEGRLEEFLSQCSSELREDIRERATSEEWMPNRQLSLLNIQAEKSQPLDSANTTDPTAGSGQASANSIVPALPEHDSALVEDITLLLNKALAESDSGAVVSVLGKLAKTHCVKQATQENGLAKEIPHKLIATGSNPEFSVVLEMLSFLGIRLTAHADLVSGKRQEQKNNI